MDDQRITQYLLAKLESQSITAQNGVRVVAIGGVWSTRSAILKCWQSCFSESSYRDLSALLDELLEMGFLVEDHTFYSHSLIEETLNIQSQQLPEFQSWLQAVENFLPTGFNWGVDVKQQIERGYRYARFKANINDWSGFVDLCRRMISDYRAAFKAASFIQAEVLNRFEMSPFLLPEKLVKLVMDFGPDLSDCFRKLPLKIYRQILLDFPDSKYQEILVTFFIGVGDFNFLNKIAEKNVHIRAIVHFFNEESLQAVNIFEKNDSKLTVYNLFYALAVIDLDRDNSFEILAKKLERTPQSPLSRAAVTLSAYLQLRLGKQKLWRRELNNLDRALPENIWHKLMLGLTLKWHDVNVWKNHFHKSHFDSTKLSVAGFHWVASQFDAINGQFSNATFRPLIRLVPEVAEWQRKLNALLALGTGKRSATVERLVWVVKCQRKPSVEPRIQKKGKDGWSKGRVISLGKLINGEISILSRYDHKVLELAQLSYSDTSGRSSR